MKKMGRVERRWSYASLDFAIALQPLHGPAAALEPEARLRFGILFQGFSKTQ
jgi:hypothetical protein